MPEHLFASNSISHFVGSTFKNDAWSYDANRVPYSIYAPPSTVIACPDWEPSTSQETWFHFRGGSNEWRSDIEDVFFECFDEDSNSLVKLLLRDQSAYGYKLIMNTSEQSKTVVKWIPVANNQMRTFDLRIQHTGLLMHVDLYINELLLLSGELSQTGERIPVRAYFGGVTGNGASGFYMSEVLISDSPTLNARLDLLRPVSGGVYGNFNGPISSLADDDPTTGMTTTLEDQKQSTILSEYTGANNISNIIQTTTTVRGINSPTKLQHFLRMSGVDYATPSFDVPFIKDYQVTDWKLNPATSLPWAASDLESLEFGFESKA